MTQILKSHLDEVRALPLVRAIGREVRERTRAIDALEAREASGECNGVLESELSAERRSLRACERELARLGYGIDADDPLRIVGQGGSFRLDDSQFFQASGHLG